MATRLSTALLIVAVLAFAGILGNGALRLPDASSGSQAGETGPAQLGGDLPGDPQIHLVQVASGLGLAVNLAFPPDNSDRMFVVQSTGSVQIVNPDGTVEPEPFLDLTNRVSFRPGQQGLLGLAFHPDYAENGRFFVYYNNLYANGAITIAEFLVDPDNPNLASLKTERPLLTIVKPFPQHNGGTLRFGADGYLYISTGDGGWQGDPYDNAQSRFSLLGKILRIDVDGGALGQPYGIPPDNPFAGPGRYDSPYPGQPPADVTPEKKVKKKDRPSHVAPDDRATRPPVHQEIWAYGFRNPWQFSFDPATGDFYVGDVGGSAWEEINFQPAGSTAGQNYGWDFLEGSHCYPPEIGNECPRQQVGVLPVAEYAHGEDGCAVIGLGVYRGPDSPALDGIYFSGEFCTGEIRGLQRDENGVWQFQNLLDTALQITGSGQDANGDLYVTAATGALVGEAPGSVWKLVGADQVPEGAITIPLGEPRQGEAAVDEDGMPIAGDAAAPADEALPADEPSTADAPADAAVTPEEGDLVMGLYDIYFEPERLTIPANTDVRIILENHGAAEHNFAIKNHDVDIDVAPGEKGVAVVNLPPGRYKFICNIPGHKQAGMNGTLVVK